VFVFLLPAVAATLGSNLRAIPYLGLSRPRPVLVGLGALIGGAGFLAANTVMALWSRLVPRSWIETFDMARLFDAPLAERVGIALVASVLAPFCEEIAFRGYLQRTLAIRRGPVVAIAGSAILFSLLHLDPIRFPALLVLGLVFGWISWRSGSTWPSIVAHAVNNGLASTIALVAGLPDASSVEPPPLQVVVQGLLIGAVALALLLRAFRNATPVPPAPAGFVVLRDPRDPGTRFRLRGLPAGVWAAAWAGLALLAVMGVAAGRSGQHVPARHHRAPPGAPGAAP
jgi:membrane protease YdiL (CAAX protease family)